MNKFLKESEKKFFEEKQKYIRETLTYHLTESLKEIEYEFKAKNNEPLTYNECSSNLCYTIEAVFLHGLKDTFLQILTSFGSDDDHKPTPSFWNFVQFFLHKTDIKEILELPQILSEIGYCRVFVRKALNDCLLSSYLQNIRKSPKMLEKFYHTYAFLSDRELSETAVNLIRDIESLVNFSLPINSSLLNVWQDKSLELAGLYTPALKSLPLPVGEDCVAGLTSTANRDIPITKQVLPDIFIPSISNSIFNKSTESLTDLDDDTKFYKTLNRIESPELSDELNYKINRSFIQYDEDELTENQPSPLIHDVPMQETQNETTPESAEKQIIENSITLGSDIVDDDITSADSADVLKNFIKDQSSEDGKVLISDEELFLRRKVSIRASAIDNYRFESIWSEKQRQSSINFQEVWSRLNKRINFQSQHNNKDINDLDETGFEFLQIPVHTREQLNVLQQMVETMGRLSTEYGLDGQGFLCKECRSPLVEISKATVCGFDGFYYCSGCISNDKYAIPAKIIFNWDFTQYHVSKRAADFFVENQFKPFIDMKILNPDIYSYIEEMNKLQKLRIQLNFLRAYIFTCSESIVIELQKILYGKEYIYETIHLYSIADLYLIQNQSFEDMLKKVVAFGRDHCMKCALCKERGYHCEYCRKSKIIYPFDVDDVMRCNQCGTVSHLKCYNPLITCPKCERKQRRSLNAAFVAE